MDLELEERKGVEEERREEEERESPVEVVVEEAGGAEGEAGGYSNPRAGRTPSDMFASGKVREDFKWQMLLFNGLLPFRV